MVLLCMCTMAALTSIHTFCKDGGSQSVSWNIWCGNIPYLSRELNLQLTLKKQIDLKNVLKTRTNVKKYRRKDDELVGIFFTRGMFSFWFGLVFLGI